MTEEFPTAAQLEGIARRALTFQRYIFRRAWGLYYAVWAAAITVFVFGYLIPPTLGFSGASFGWLTYALLYGGVGTAAGVESANIFRNARRALQLRRTISHDNLSAMQGKKFGRKSWLHIIPWIWWAGFYVIIFFLFTLFPRGAFSGLYASLFLVEVFIYFELKLCFPKKIPFEGKAALASYGASTLLSLAVSFLSTTFSFLFTALWVPTICVWVFCALYALRHAPDELTELMP
jgi:hypothetical protein